MRASVIECSRHAQHRLTDPRSALILVQEVDKPKHKPFKMRSLNVLLFTLCAFYGEMFTDDGNYVVHTAVQKPAASCFADVV